MGTRRQFVKQSSLGAAAMGASMVLPTELLASIRKTISPNDKIQVGLIGCKGMGFSDLSSMLQNSEVEVVALCDVDENVLREKTAELEKGGIKKLQNST